MLDHSETYRLNKLKHIPHVARLRKIREVVKQYGIARGTLADFGCSNGFITNIIRDDLQASSASGFDHSENIEVARLRYRDIVFDYVDLNRFEPGDTQFDTVTCFETIEHVGKPEVAIRQLLNKKSPGGVIIISVPIEIGFVGIIKYIIKRLFYRYPIELNVTNSRYLKALFTGERISKFRNEADGYSTHFGFDYRDVSDVLRKIGVEKYKTWRSFTTQFFVIGHAPS